MGSVLSYLTEDNENGSRGEPAMSKESITLEDSFLPLNQKVKVHLVPKFYASDDGAGSFLLVTLKKMCLFIDAREQCCHTANVEFHQGDVSLSAREVFGRPRTCAISTVEESDIEVREVIIKKGECLRISGVFTSRPRRTRSVADLEHSDSFDLILCPSTKITPHPGDWALLGTLYTKPVNLSRERQWKAAVRKDFA